MEVLVDTEKEQSHPTENELIEYGSMLQTEGENFARMCMPHVAVHLAKGCDACNQFLEDLESGLQA